MDDIAKQKAIRALAITHLFQNGMMSPNCPYFESKLARMLLHPNFMGKGICLRHMKEVFFELSQEVMED